ncbi:hypothetical protein SDC9_205194 [bioreactor metagenome]|uniref:Uncharacterized protein n=1 Tax=bioreactor metagenome TaxID=1076179 RepID=A0A645J2Y8_9ZZZZ
MDLGEKHDVFLHCGYRFNGTRYHLKRGAVPLEKQKDAIYLSRSALHPDGDPVYGHYTNLAVHV